MAPLLIIDNDTFSRTHLARQLESYGYDVQTAATPDEAVHHLTKAYSSGTPYGAICLASMVGCPEVGHHLAMRIRALRGYRATRILGGSFDKVFWKEVAHFANFISVEIRFLEDSANSVWNIRQVRENLPFPLTRAA